MSIVDLLRSSTRREPGAVALVHGERRIRYGELLGQIGGAARRLTECGLAPGGRVALLLENSPEYVINYYGALAAGGTVVALNTAARAQDLASQISHCGAFHLVTDVRQRESAALRVLAPRVEVVDADEVPNADTLPAIALAPEQPAAIIYTSGTTGRPKGVTLSHGNLEANVRSILEYLELGSHDVLVNVLPFYYSYGNSVLHTHLAAGARLVLDRGLVYPQGVLEAMAAERATGFSGVPSSYAVLLGRCQPEKYDLSWLRYLTQAGGPMATPAIARVRGLWPHARFFVMYGQTEATARLTYLPPERLDEKAGSVGIPIPGVEISIRDENGDAVPPGTCGEIWASGPNVMLGYWKDTEATTGILVQGWLRTGDLAHQDRDGYIFLDGRRSEMIKAGAHRISPVEIEEVIAELHGVEEVAVAGIPDPFLGEAIKAVIVPRAGSALDAMTVQHHCRDRLPSYKVPREIEFRTALPRTASGKIQRFLLAQPRENRGDTDVVARTGSNGTGSTGGQAVAD